MNEKLEALARRVEQMRSFMPGPIMEREVDEVAADLRALAAQAGDGEAYCPQCQASGMRNCSDFVNCGNALATQPREQAGAGAVACHHEAYQGACIHCGVAIRNGKAAHPAGVDGVDDAMVERALTAYNRERGSYAGEIPTDPADIRAALTAALGGAK